MIERSRFPANVELKVALAAGDGGVVADHLDGDHHQRLGLRRVHRARHDRRAWFVRRQDELVQTRTRLDAVGVVDGQVDAARPPVLLAAGLDRLRDRGVVADRRHLPQVLRQQAVVQDLIAVPQGLQVDVLRQVGRLRYCA
jgi:hypothetical protein